MIESVCECNVQSLPLLYFVSGEDFKSTKTDNIRHNDEVAERQEKSETKDKAAVFGELIG